MKKIFSFGLALSTLLTFNLVNPTKNSVCLAVLSELEGIDPRGILTNVADRINTLSRRNLPEEKEELVTFENLYAELNNILENPSISNSEKILSSIIIMSSLMDKLLDELREIYSTQLSYVHCFVDEIFNRVSCFEPNQFFLLFFNNPFSIDNLKTCIEIIPAGEIFSNLEQLVLNLISGISKIKKAKLCPVFLAESELYYSNEKILTPLLENFEIFRRKLHETDEYVIDERELLLIPEFEEKVRKIQEKYEKTKNEKTKKSNTKRTKKKANIFVSEAARETMEIKAMVSLHIKEYKKKRVDFFKTFEVFLNEILSFSNIYSVIKEFGKKIEFICLIHRNSIFFGKIYSKKIEENLKELPERVSEIIDKNSPEEAQKKAMELFSSLDPKNAIVLNDIVNAVLTVLF